MRRFSGFAAVLALLGGLMAVASPAAAQTSPGAIDISPIVVQKCCTTDGTHQIIGGQGWEIGDAIDLFINEMFVATSIAEPNDEGTASPFFDIDAVGVYLNPGDVVTFVRPSDGRTETHTVTYLSVQRMSVPADTVTGSAEPGSEVVVFIPNTLIFRSETADTEGNWTADFSGPGDQPGEDLVFDIDIFTTVAAAQFDTDGNATLWVTSPGEYTPVIVLVDGAELVGSTGPQFITGQSWSEDEAVDLLINGEYLATTMAEVNSEGSASPFFDLSALGVAVVSGDVVTLARPDGTRTETHTVTPLTLTKVDVVADTVAGTAEPGSLVFVSTVRWLSDAPDAFVLATTDEAGEWLADFSAILDVVPTTVGQAGQFDDAGNSTALFWRPELTSKDDCKKGGWQNFGFKNQGQCIRAVG